jgi:hypothetical protein
VQGIDDGPDWRIYSFFKLAGGFKYRQVSGGDDGVKVWSSGSHPPVLRYISISRPLSSLNAVRQRKRAR